MALTNGNGNHVNSTPAWGRRLVPHIIDDMARTEPDREVFSYPRTSDTKDGWRPVSFKLYANAINRVARKIINTCGVPEPGSFPTIAYIGPNDPRYVILFIAAVKAGYKALLISPRNSQEAQLSLFEATDCRFMFFPKTHRQAVQPWLQERDMQAVEIGSLESWLSEEEVEHFPYDKTFEEAEWDPLAVLHTSGSTGIPKPIVVCNGMLSKGDGYHVVNDPQGRKNFIRAVCDLMIGNYVPMPLFHAAGIYAFVTCSIYFLTPTSFGFAERPLTPDVVMECLAVLNVSGTLLPPAILEDISQHDHYIDQLLKLRKVFYAGGSLNPEAGNRLVDRGIHLNSIISSTECFPFPIFEQPNAKLWQYFIIDSKGFGADWRKIEGEDDVYRLVSVRNKNDRQGFFYTFPDLDEFDTGDLYKKHPTLPDHWTYAGRSDNIIVFSNGEKLNPVTIEDILTHHPELKGVVVAGSGRFQPCLVLEPFVHPKNEAETRELIDRVWPLVVTANKQTVAHGQIGREFIMISSEQKPFLRAGKGTIQKAGTLKLYAREIDELYQHAGEVSVEAPALDLTSQDTLAESIQSLFQTHIGFEGTLAKDVDFFSAGIDSIQVISLSRLLRAGLESAGYQVDAEAIATPAIYTNPTSKRLAAYIFSHISGTVTAKDESHEIEWMKATWEKYTSDLPKATAGRPDPVDEGQTVLITGTTGTLGSHMLDKMLKNPAVKRIVCLNRGEDGGKKRQAEMMKDRKLAQDLDSKCTFLRADMSRWDFGLPEETFNELLQTADRFIHNAWPVNFNISVESFEPHIRSVRNIGDFATKSAKRVAVVFISSISTGDHWDVKDGLLPERRLEDLHLPAGGYGRSKALSSLILEDVAKAGDFPAAIIRVGQVGGPEADAGCWNKQEWLPSIIASSVYLGALPSSLGGMDRVDWTPVESIAGLILDVDGISQKVPANEISGYYHGVNPQATSWGELATAVQAFYGKERIGELVDLTEWVRRLDKSSQNGDMKALDRNPGIKLLDTYRGMASGAAFGNGQIIFDMTKTQVRSPSMRNASPMSPKLMLHWCKQWKF